MQGCSLKFAEAGVDMTASQVDVYLPQEETELAPTQIQAHESIILPSDDASLGPRASHEAGIGPPWGKQHPHAHLPF
jgi:hypothetical protein